MFRHLRDWLLPNQTLNIRPATEEDKILLLDIFNMARLAAGCFRKNLTNQAEFDKITQGEILHVAEFGGRVAGFVSIDELEGFIHHLYVSPSFQSQGVGKALLHMCEQQYGLPLSLRCICTNERALDFYRRNGWITKGYGIGSEGPWEHLSRNCPPRNY